MRLVADNLAGDRGGEPVFDGLSFALSDGECLIVTGENGSGKSTLLRIVAGLLPASGGSVTLEGGGEEWPDVMSACHHLGDRNAMKPALTVAENLKFRQEFLGRPFLSAEEALEEVALPSVASLPFGYLSTGQRRRVAIAGLLVAFRPVWLLDEPTAGLDPEAAVDLIEYLKQMIRGLHTTVIICTHQLHGLEALCDDVGILVSGRLVVAGDVQQLLRHRWPRRDYAITVDGDRGLAAQLIATTLGEPATPADGPAGDGHLDVSVDDEDAISSVVEALVRNGLRVRAVVPQRPTLHDLYFAAVNDRDAS